MSADPRIADGYAASRMLGRVLVAVVLATIILAAFAVAAHAQETPWTTTTDQTVNTATLTHSEPPLRTQTQHDGQPSTSTGRDSLNSDAVGDVVIAAAAWAFAVIVVSVQVGRLVRDERDDRRRRATR